MSKNIIVGAVGLFSSGKDTLAEYLEKHGFIHYSLSDILREELKKNNLEENIPNLANIGNEIRKNYGFGELAIRTLNKIKKNKQTKVVVSSIRHTSEIEELKKGGNFFLIEIKAPIKLRYQRSKSRGRLSDDMDFEKFKSEEEKQLAGADHKMQLSNCIKSADHTIDNDGSLDELHTKIDKVISKLNK